MEMRSEQLRRQVNALWVEARGRFDHVRGNLEEQRVRLSGDLNRLVREREQLLKKLGEQTYKLVSRGDLPVPQLVRSTVQRINEVVGKIVESGAAQTKSPRRKARARRPGVRRSKKPTPTVS